MEPLEDTQNERDQRNIAIRRVGIREIRHPLRFRDRDGTAQPTVATVAMSVALSAERRGTHMSRFVSILAEEASGISVADLPDLLEKMCHRLEAQAGTITFDFPYFINKRAPVTGSEGRLDYEVRLECTRERGGQTTEVTVEVPITTLCPCSRNISERGAHNQRGVVILTVAGDDLPSVEQLIALVETCGSSELYSVLKRPDEKHVTELAFDQPVFVEDLVRNVALKLKKLDGITAYRIEGENFESIHNHNAFAVVMSDPT